MPTKRVTPRKTAIHGHHKEATSITATSGPHFPGDEIEMRVSIEVPGTKGGGAWVTAGLKSIHQPNETAQECDERVFGWVAETVINLQTEASR